MLTGSRHELLDPAGELVVLGPDPLRPGTNQGPPVVGVVELVLGVAPAAGVGVRREEPFMTVGSPRGFATVTTGHGVERARCPAGASATFGVSAWSDAG